MNTLLNKKDLVAFNQEVGERGEFSNESSLDYALNIAQTKKNWLYGLSYLLRSLLVDHVFEDGNKRTGLAVIIYYLEHYQKSFDRDKLLSTVKKIAAGNITNPVLIARLIYHVIEEKD